MWLGSVLSIVDTVIAVKKTMDAYEVHKKCAKDAQPISEYLKTTSEEARKISTVWFSLFYLFYLCRNDFFKIFCIIDNAPSV